jgi:hypothetical protein
MKGFHEVVQVSVAFKKKRGMEAILESLNIERKNRCTGLHCEL